jgi:hypothetical protein
MPQSSVVFNMGFSFSDHIGLLGQFLAGRQQIVEDIDRRLLNARGNAAAQRIDRGFFEDVLTKCFFESPAVSSGASRLKGQLAAAHLAEGFDPVPADGHSREIDPVGLVRYAQHVWDRDRWPGRNGRLNYAQSLYAVCIIRQLAHLSLRIWDDGNDMASTRLQEVQRLLDLLNTTGAAPLVRDARWLIQVAQGPLTTHLKPYFVMADRVAGSFGDRDRREIHKAGAALAGGHLRSQLRHRSWQTGWAHDDRQVIALTHLSNSMDMALLIRDLVSLLEAYRAACLEPDGRERLELADAILQGLSADPELLLTRLDLLGPSTMIEDLFCARGEDGGVRFTAAGQAHGECLRKYAALIGQTAASLKKDALSLDPAHAVYSPLGVVYGFCADILSNMVLNTLHASSSADLSLEDTFISLGQLEQKRAQAQEWQCLPKDKGERDAFEYSTDWAAAMFARMVSGLEARAARPTEPNASAFPASRLYVVPRGAAIDSWPEGALPAGIVSAQEHCLTSDDARARETGATALSRSRLSTDRAEGRFLASLEADGAWFGVSKALLAICTSQGKDTLICDVPPGVIDVLRLTCSEILVLPTSPE